MSEMTSSKTSPPIDTARIVAELDRGILNDRAEDLLPDELFGPPTPAERAAAAANRRVQPGHNGAAPSRPRRGTAARKPRAS
jgi:hypothetical protein